MLTVALPKSRLLGQFTAWCEDRDLRFGALLAEAGRRLVVEDDSYRFLLLKDADVPVYVEQGVADCGVAGLDQILDRDADVIRLIRFPFGACRLCLIGRVDRPQRESTGAMLLASKYATLAARLAARRGLQATVVPLAGSVELAARLELADAVVDLVETGRTLRENGLHVIAEWLPVAPYLIANRAAFHLRRNELCAFRRALGGRR